jgi:hypothetical protein
MIIASLVRLFFFISITAGLIYILLGAVEWLKSSERPEMVDDARRKIKYASLCLVVLGLLLGSMVFIEQVIFSGSRCLGISCQVGYLF